MQYILKPGHIFIVFKTKERSYVSEMKHGTSQVKEIN